MGFPSSFTYHRLPSDEILNTCQLIHFQIDLKRKKVLIKVRQQHMSFTECILKRSE